MNAYEYAAKHGIAYRTVCRLIREGKLPYTMVAGRTRYDIAEDAGYLRGKPGRKANLPQAPDPAVPEKTDGQSPDTSAPAP